MGFQGLNCLAPTSLAQKRWLEDLSICVVFAEDLVTVTDKSNTNTTTTTNPPRFYVEAMIRGQKLPMHQKTDEIVPATKTEKGYYCVEWYSPMKFKVCVQSLFRNPTLEFRVFQVTEINRKLVDKEFGVASVSLKKVYDLGDPNSMVRLTITPKFGRSSKGVLCITKVMDSST